jgi:holo-[acyl-carrier protein] synthase
MILGMGIDLVEIKRMGTALRRWGGPFRKRLFTDREWRECAQRQRQEECLAGKFAAKEALFKALSTGVSQGIGWRQVEVVHSPGGAPMIEVTGKARDLLLSLGMQRIWVSLSHDGGFSIAVVVVEG